MNTNILKSIDIKKFELFMLFSICIHTITFIAFNEISDIFRAILIAGSIPALWWNKSRLKKDPMFWLFIAAIAIQCISWLNSLLNMSEFANSIPKLDRLGKLFTFLLLIFWLKGEVKNTYLILASLLVGILFGFVFQPDFSQEISRALKGIRVDFDIKNAQFTSMYAGTALILSLFSIKKAIQSKTPHSLKLALTLLTTLLALFFLFITIVTQSRQVWLALIVVVLSLPLLLLMTRHIKSTKSVIFSYISVILISGLIYSQSAIVQNRVHAEQSTISMILSGNWEDIPMNSAGIRFNSWIAAAEWIKEYPLVGIGANGPKQVLLQSELIQSRISEAPHNLKHIGHFHNNHIENMVAYGLLGFVLILSVYIFLPISLLKVRHAENKDLLLFSLCFVVYWMTINSFESFNTRGHGVFVHTIIFASLYHLYFYRDKSSKKGAK